MATKYKYVGTGWVAGVPCRDLTAEEWAALKKARKGWEDSPAAANWEKEAESRSSSPSSR